MPTTQSSPPTRHSLLMRLRDGQDHEAWKVFVATYAPAIHRFLVQQGLQEADALDVSQDALLAVAADIGRFEHCEDRSGSFRKWLFTIVRNRAIDYWRRERKQPSGGGDSRVAQALAILPAADDGLEEQWTREYLATVFHAAAHQVKGDFKPATWQAFWRTTVEHDSPQKVAAALGLSVRTVYLAKRRVLQRIQQQIEYLEGDML